MANSWLTAGCYRAEFAAASAAEPFPTTVLARRVGQEPRVASRPRLRLLQPEDRLALGEGDPHPLPDRVRLFARERENVAQEGFDAPVHRISPPYRLSA